MDDTEIDLPAVVAEVRAAFEQYERDLVANDVEALIRWFWVDDRAVRYGIDESHISHARIAEYRRAQAQATPPRDLARTVLTTFGTDMATVNTEFVLDSGGPDSSGPDSSEPDSKGVVGRQSQTWARVNGEWRIVSAHVSWLSGRRP